MNKISVRKILLITYAFIAGAILGGGFALLIIVPLFQLIIAIITGSDRGVLWTNYFIYASFVLSVFGGIYISEKWCLSYLSRRDTRK